MREHGSTGTEVWDGIRGVAVLSVLCYHTWLFSWFTPALSVFGRSLPVASPVRTGYLGVEIFFVISGFVLFLPYARAPASGDAAPPLAEFARRRFLKIVPSYALALGATVLATHLTAPTLSLRPTILEHVFFVQNSWTDNLGASNSVFWSLAIEVQFYLVFPALARAFVRAPVVTATAMTGIAFWYRFATGTCCLQWETVTRQLPAYLDLFACGMLAAHVFVRLRTRADVDRSLRRNAIVVACGALAVWAALIAGADAQSYAPGGREWWTIEYRTAIGLTVATFGVASSLATAWWRMLVANRVLTFLGLISYNLYLWHTLVLIWMWKHDIPHAATSNPHDDPRWRVAYIALGWPVCLAVATALTYFVERPLLGGVRRRAFAWHPMKARPGAASGTRT